MKYVKPLMQELWNRKNKLQLWSECNMDFRVLVGGFSASQSRDLGKSAHGFAKIWSYPRGVGSIDGKHLE